MSRTWRLFLAGITTLSLHTIILCWPITSDKTILPAPLAVQRIVVSLGATPAVKEVVPNVEPEKEIVTKKEVVPQPLPRPRPEPKPNLKPKPKPKQPELRPVTSPVVQPAPKPQPIQKQKIVPEDQPPLQTEISEEQKNSKTDTAAHIIQQATPLYQVNPPPKYPRLARRRGLEGVVLLETLIDDHGRVKELRIVLSSGHSVLDKAAIKAVRNWRFNAGTIGGRPQEMWVQVPIRFQLQ